MEYRYITATCTKEGVNQWVYKENKEVLNRMAEDGYRYCGFIPLVTNGLGVMEKIELVFVKENH